MLQIHTLIIAEAGVNHNGSLDLAKELVDVAVNAGVDYIKFQTFKASKLANVSAGKADYQLKNMKDKDNSQLRMLEKLELIEADHYTLLEYCKTKKIGFLSSAFDLDSIIFLHQFNLDFWKIPSGEITNLPYLRKIGSYNGKVILSTGMSNLGEIETALAVLTNSGTKKENITILHCNTEYPTPIEDVNLLAMLTIKDAFKVNIGYSDHTLGIEIPIAAVAMGACMIEKHITLDRNMEGPDHRASLEPDELKAMVKAIRNIEQAIGNGIKEPTKSEKKNIVIARKSIHAKVNINRDELFTENNIIAKRPGGGISPMLWDEVIGKKADRDYQKDEKIEF